MATTTNRAGARAAPRAPAPPRPVRIPAPERLLGLVRLLAFVLLLAWLSWGWWLPLALDVLQDQPAVRAWLRTRPTLIHTGLTLWALVLWGVLATYGVQLMGLVGSLWLQLRRPLRSTGTVLQITLPPPHSPQAVPEGNGVDFWTGFYRFMVPLGRLRGTAPRMAFALHGTPAQPIDLQVWVPTGEVPASSWLRRLLPERRGRGDRAARQGKTWSEALTKVLHGVSPDLDIAPVADPLASACPEGAVRRWRDFRLAVSSAYPLRRPSDLVATDLLGPLASGLQPRHGSIHFLRLELIVLPVKGIFFRRDWHGRGMRLLMRAQARAEYSLADDLAGIEAKLDGVAYEVTVRLIGQGSDAAALDAELDEARLILGQYHARTLEREQELVRDAHGTGARWAHVQGRRLRPVAPPQGLLPWLPLRRPSILGALELDGLWHVPPAVQGGLIRMRPNRLILPPAWAFIPPGDPFRIAIGIGRRPDGSEGPVGPALRNLRQVFHAVGGMGSRKSQLGANIAQQLIPHGFMLADGKGGDKDNLTSRVRELIPLEDEQRLVLIDFMDAKWPIGINPLWAPAGTAASEGMSDQLVGQTLAMFGKLDPKTWPSAAGMRDQLTMALLLVLEAERNPTLPQVRQVFVDPDYRERLLPQCTNLEVQEFWRVTYAAMGEGHKTSRDALFRRFNLLLLPNLVRHVVCQRTPSVDIGQVIDQKLILLCPLADNKLGDLARSLGMLLISSIVKAAFEREGTAQTRHDMTLMIDELGVFLNEFDNSDMRTALSRLRSLGIPQVYFNQALSQLHDLEDLLLINNGNRTILQTLEPDAPRLAKTYGLDPADIKDQSPDTHQYADFRVQMSTYEERRTFPCSVRPLPWPDPLALKPAPYAGPAWSDQWAPATTREASALDVVYRELAARVRVDPTAALTICRGWSEDQWTAYQQRTEAHRRHQRQWIINHPACIEHRFERQDWLSRLQWSRPVFEAMVDYVRARREVPLTGEAPGKTTRGGIDIPSRQRPAAQGAPAAGSADGPRRTQLEDDIDAAPLDLLDGDLALAYADLLDD